MTRFFLAIVFCSLGSAGSFAQPQPANPPAAEEDLVDEVRRVVPVFEPGSHTRSICALAFTKDKSKLITVGEDFTIQIWSTVSGQRLDILHLPGFGHEQGYAGKEWDVAAISHDGRYVAIGGGQKQFASDEKLTSRAKLVVVDIQRRTVRNVIIPNGSVSALAFDPDNRLAVANGRNATLIQIFGDATEASDRPLRKRNAVALTDDKATESPTVLQFSPDGKRLFSTVGQRAFVIWDLSGEKPRIVNRLDLQGHTSAACWSPNGKHIARAYNVFGEASNGVDILTADGQVVREFHFSKFPALDLRSRATSLAFLDVNSVLMTTDGGQTPNDPGSAAVRLDFGAEQASCLVSQNSPGKFPALTALSADQELAAMTVSMGLDVVIYRVKDGSVVARCGAASPVPTVVGWSAKGQPPGFAWSEVAKPGRFNTAATDLQFGFDLKNFEPLAEVTPADFGVASLKQGEWSVQTTAVNAFDVHRGATVTGSFQGGNGTAAITLVPQGAEPPLVAAAARWALKGAATLSLSKTDSTRLTRWLPRAVYTRDMAPSPDGRYVIVSTGTHRLCIYATDGSPYPLLSFARVNGHWVAWSGEGYYTASPGGEKMIGWAVSNGPDKLSTFYPAGTFSKQFRRPEILARAIALGSVELALKELETRAPNVEQFLPPECELKLIKTTGAMVTVQAKAAPLVNDKPVVSLRLLLNGRPLTGGQGYAEFTAGQTAVATWDVEIPAGSHELKVFARSEEGSAKSPPLIVESAAGTLKPPVIFRLCVGINQYDVEGLRLKAAARDASEVYQALDKYCVGPDNRFGEARGKLLLDSQATRANVKSALAEIRAQARPGDLVVFMFAGHGVKQKGEYYLMTREGDLTKSLNGASLSGADLRAELTDMQCPVLLLMDACYSANGVQAFRPATDDLTNDLTHDSIGVTVMAATMSNEKASATVDNGYFTAAFLKALSSSQGDPYNHKLYPLHIMAVVFSEVRHATADKQNPHLTSPTTEPPIVLRHVPQSVSSR